MSKKLLFCLATVAILSSFSAAHEWSIIANPPPRHAAKMICDARNERMIMFGGGNVRVPWGGNYNDVWTLDLKSGNQVWQPISPSGPPPSPRQFMTAVYDSSTQRMIVFGGTNDYTDYFDDVWVLALEQGNERWEEMGTSGLTPSPRCGAAAVYDYVGKRMVIFGGSDHDQFFNEAWCLYPDRATWLPLRAMGTPPAPRNTHTAVYDPLGPSMIVFGGKSDIGMFDDVWVLELTMGVEMWSELPTSGEMPGGIAGHVAVYDCASRRMYTFGGYRYPPFEYPDDVFCLDLNSSEWSRISARQRPHGRRSACGDLDSENRRLIVFGGSRYYDYYFGDTYAFEISEPIPRLFTDVTFISGLSGDTHSYCGIAWGDFNNDGYHDLYTCYRDGLPNVLWRNNEDGTFTDVTSVAGVAGGFVSSNAGAWGDYDNDGDLDLYVSDSGGNFLYRNNGNGTFSDVTYTAGVGHSGNDRTGAWGDYDADGDLDLFVPSRDGTDVLYRNNGDGTFSDATSAVGMVNIRGHAASWCDYDNDGDMDLYVGRYWDVNSLYRNNGNGTFTDVASEAGVAHYAACGVSWGDYDNDGDFDLYVGHPDTNVLYRNSGDGTFVDVAEMAGVDNPGRTMTVIWADYDSDGDLDLYVGNHYEENNALYRNDADGTFTDVMSETGISNLSGGQNAAWCDYDNDGDIDICLTHRSVGILYRNNGGGNNWMEINLVGDDCNTFGVGTRVTLVTGQLRQVREVCTTSGLQSQGSLTLEYGLGRYGLVDTIEIRWPCGKIDRLTDVPANQILTIEENTVDTADDDYDVVPTVFFLGQNHPNPFRNETVIRYGVPIRGSDGRTRVALKIYDSAGRLVKTLSDGDHPPGYYSVKWDCADENGEKVGAGIYFCTMAIRSIGSCGPVGKPGEFRSTRKMTVLR